MSSSNAVKAGDAYIQVSVDGLAEIKAEMSNIRSEIASGFDKTTRNTAISALADGFKMVSSAIKTASQAVMWFSGKVMQAVERVSELQKIADRLGTSLTFISRIKIAAVTSNMSMNELEQAFAAFQRNMETFSQGVGEARATFESLGITPGMLKSWGSLEKQMTNIIIRLGQVQDPSQRAGAAMRIFGEQGRKLIPLVNANAKAFKSLMDQADFLGLTLDESAGRSLDRVRDNSRLLNEQLNGLWNNVAVNLGPELEKLTNELIVSVKVLSHIVTKGTELKDVIDSIADAVKPLTKAFAYFHVVLTTVKLVYTSFVELVRRQYAFLTQPINTLLSLYDTSVLSKTFGYDSIAKSSEAVKEASAAVAASIKAANAIDADFDKSRSEWKELIKASQPVTMAIKSGAEDMKEAAKEINRAFSGEVLGRTAEDLKKSREISERTLKGIEAEMRSVNKLLREAPVVRGFAS